jgi:hypothetical protein
MAFYEIAGMDAYRSPEHAQAAETPWTARVRPHRLTPRIAFYQQTFPQEGTVQGPAWCDGTANEGGLLVVRTDVAPEHEPDFNAWYDEEHLYALCTVPGVIAARRFKAIEGEPRYMAIYHLEAPDVQASVGWKQAIDTPWSARARAAFRNPWRVVYQPRR